MTINRPKQIHIEAKYQNITKINTDKIRIIIKCQKNEAPKTLYEKTKKISGKKAILEKNSITADSRISIFEI